MVIFEIVQTQNLIQIYTKTHHIAPFKKKFLGRGGHAPEPPSKAHGISKSQKNISCPPPPKSWGRPWGAPTFYAKKLI